MKCSSKTIQRANGCEYITRVKHDKHGNPSLTGDGYTDSPANANTKYEKEVRFALRIGFIKHIDRNVAGKPIKECNHIYQTILAQ